MSRQLYLFLFACAGLSAQNGAPAVKPEDLGIVEGAVLNSATGEPIKKAKVWLRPFEKQDAPPYTAITDDAGHFLLDDIDPGRYTVSATRTGFVEKGFTRRPITLTLAAGRKIGDVVLKLTPQGVISGQVLDEDGEPVPQAVVQCLRVGYPNGKKQLAMAGMALSNDIGEYRLPNLPPGKYYVSASVRSMARYPGRISERPRGGARALKDAEEIYVQTFYPNATHSEAAVPIDISPGRLAQGIDVRVVRARPVSIRGRVVNRPTGATGTLDVRLLPPEQSASLDPPNWARNIQEDGAFELQGVMPGSYTLTAQQNVDDKLFSAHVPLEVGSSNIEKIELRLVASGEISGRLVIEGDPSTKPKTSLFVDLQIKGLGNRGRPNRTQIGDDLTFKVSPVSPDQYDVGILNLPDDYYLKSISLGDQDLTDTGVDFTQGIPASELVLTISSNGGQVEGTVQNEKSEPAIGATVALVPEASRRSLGYSYKVASADQSGHFTLTGIKPGKYKLFAWEEVEPLAYRDADYLKPYESVGEAVSIEEKGHQVVQLKSIPAEGGATEKNARKL
jgi:protocatechuate 3,4-dioxygenase beta subunit